MSNSLSYIGLALYVVSAVLLLGFWIGVGRAGRTLLRLERTVDRIEAAAEVVAQAASVKRDVVAKTLVRMERATEVVADNLADSVSRADATEGPEGAAADAALRTGDTAAAIHERQRTQ